MLVNRAPYPSPGQRWRSQCTMSNSPVATRAGAKGGEPSEQLLWAEKKGGSLYRSENERDMLRETIIHGVTLNIITWD